ncbi:MAG: hypothetical protein KDA84_10130, partial [Planctomycetaceae bacterium]|nr:hypothetical protein [Planctomycetaceae bacterium]
MSKWMLGLGLVVVIGLIRFSFSEDDSPKPSASRETRQKTIFDFGVVGDGTTDDTVALQKAVDSGLGSIRFEKGVYRITQPIVIDLDKVGFT